MHLAYSRDGLKWTPLGGGRPFLAPTVGGKLIRDPCIVLGPDNVFHAVWTTGWYEQGIGIAHSKNLITWSEAAFLPVMVHERKAVNAWAPEIFFDDETGQYLIFWATTIPGRFPATDELRQREQRRHCAQSPDLPDDDARLQGLQPGGAVPGSRLQRDRRHDCSATGPAT